MVDFLRKLGSLTCLLIWCAGCGDSLESTVQGVVTYQGTPVPDTMVNFHPKQRSPTAYDMTDRKGRYSLQSGTSRGIMPGGYWVTVSAPPDAELPEKYRMSDTSGLEFDVVSGKNQIDIVME